MRGRLACWSFLVLIAVATPASKIPSLVIEGAQEPSAVAVDGSGAIYLCEAGGHRVSVFDANGEPLRRWGRWGRGDGEFDRPQGIAATEDGHVYVADTGNDRIQVFTTDGRFVAQWGQHGTDSGQFDEPLGIAVSGDRVYVADSRNDRIQIFDRDGKFIQYVWSSGYHDGAFDRPVGVAVDPEGFFYVSDQGNSRIQKFTPDGRFALSWGGRGRRGGLLVEPGGLDERDGQIVVADPDTHRLVAYDRAGRLNAEWTVAGENGASRIDAPSAVAILPGSGAFVVCAAVQDLCQIVTPQAGLVSAAEENPRRIARTGYAVGGKGDSIVIASRETGVPLIVDLSGPAPAIVLRLGGPGREPLEFIRPAGFDLDLPSGTVVVCDGGNGRLQRLKLARAHDGRSRFDAAGTRYVRGIDVGDHERLNVEPGAWTLDPATIEPGGIARDARGRLVVADTVGRRVVVLGGDFHLVGAWGGFGDEDGRFRSLTGLTTNGAGTTLYTLDAGRRRVQAFDLDGRLEDAWGAFGAGGGEFTEPSGIAVGPDESVYVVDRGTNRVQRFSPRGLLLAAWGATGSGPGQLWKPEAIHVDRRGRVIVIDSGNRRAEAFTSGGRFLGELSLDPGPLASSPKPPPAPSRAVVGKCRYSAVSNGGRYTVCATSVPDPIPLGEPFNLDVSVYANRKPRILEQNVILEIGATMPQHRHGMTTKPSVAAIGGPAQQDILPGHGAMGNGRFEIQGMLFHMPGRWQIHFDITHGAITERAQLDVDPGVSFTDDERRRILELSPLGPPPPDPSNAYADNDAAARLGQKLFFEPRLSGSGVSCATCHVPALGFSDGKQVSEGAGRGRRHTQTLWNVGYNRWYFWDGRADSLWSQALDPLENPNEMAGGRRRAAELLASDAALRSAYASLFGAMPELTDTTDVDTVFTNVGKAIEAYERRLVSRRSEFDRFVEGLRAREDVTALSSSARRGLKLFVGRAGCRTCHGGPNFTDSEFHNTGIAPLDAAGSSDAGRYQGITTLLASPFNLLGRYSDDRPASAGGLARYLRRTPETWGQFKTPSLRNVARTAPYMHQGQLATLRDVVSFYSTSAGNPDPGAGGETVLKPLHLSASELDDLVAFLTSLTDESIDPALLQAP